MAEKRAIAPFKFSERSENINGQYLQMTHIREMGNGWLIGGVFSFLLWILCILGLLNWEYLTPENLLPKVEHSGGLIGKMLPWIALPTAIVGFFVLGATAAMVLLSALKDGRGWTINNSAFAKWYGRWRTRQKGWHHEAGIYYFSVFARTAMEVKLTENQISVKLPEGEKRYPYTKVCRHFQKMNLHVLRVLVDEDKEEFLDIIFDAGTLSEEERDQLSDFLTRKEKEFMNPYIVYEPWRNHHEP